MKIVLAGSAEISVRAFEEVINNFDVVAIITQPDRPKGRGLNVESTPVSKLASRYKIKTFKPNKIIEIKNELEKLDFDLFLTFAFGQWIPTSILSLGKYKPMNIHGSLLPKYRGAAPIHYAILNGDKEIGITLMEMVKEMDAGDMYFQASKKINNNTTTGDGFKIVEELASSNIVNWIKKIQKENIKPIKQGNVFSLSPKIDKKFAELDNSLTVNEAIRKIKAMNPFPGAFIYRDNKRIKIFDVTKEQINNSIELNFKDGNLYSNEYQLEGKKITKI